VSGITSDESAKKTNDNLYSPYCLQCFDTVGWAAEGQPACKKWGMVEVGTG